MAGQFCWGVQPSSMHAQLSSLMRARPVSLNWDGGVSNGRMRPLWATSIAGIVIQQQIPRQRSRLWAKGPGHHGSARCSGVSGLVLREPTVLKPDNAQQQHTVRVGTVSLAPGIS